MTTYSSIIAAMFLSVLTVSSMLFYSVWLFFLVKRKCSHEIQNSMVHFIWQKQTGTNVGASHPVQIMFPSHAVIPCQ